MPTDEVEVQCERGRTNMEADPEVTAVVASRYDHEVTEQELAKKDEKLETESPGVLQRTASIIHRSSDVAARSWQVTRNAVGRLKDAVVHAATYNKRRKEQTMKRISKIEPSPSLGGNEDLLEAYKKSENLTSIRLYFEDGNYDEIYWPFGTGIADFPSNRMYGLRSDSGKPGDSLLEKIVSYYADGDISQLQGARVYTAEYDDRTFIALPRPFNKYTGRFGFRLRSFLRPTRFVSNRSDVRDYAIKDSQQHQFIGGVNMVVGVLSGIMTLLVTGATMDGTLMATLPAYGVLFATISILIIGHMITSHFIRHGSNDEGYFMWSTWVACLVATIILSVVSMIVFTVENLRRSGIPTFVMGKIVGPIKQKLVQINRVS